MNYCSREDGEIYANDVVIELQRPTATNGKTGTADGQDDEDEGELYANYDVRPTSMNDDDGHDDDQDEGELYANDVVISPDQPTVANAAPTTADDDDEGELYQNIDVDRTEDQRHDGDDGETDEEYQNAGEASKIAEQQRAPSSDDDDEPIYQNVTGSRKPKPAPKPARRC